MRELFSICGGEERKAQNTAEQIFWVIPASYGSSGQYLLKNGASMPNSINNKKTTNDLYNNVYIT